jgi:hypothetical protein
MSSIKGFFLPELPPLPSIFNDLSSIESKSIKFSESDSCSAGFKDSSESIRCISFPNLEIKDLVPSTQESDSEDFTELDSIESIDDYRANNVIKTGKILQKLIYDFRGKEMNITQHMKIKNKSIEFVKMFLNDYHSDMYHHIVAVLLDCKAMAKDFGFTEEKEIIEKGLNMIKIKAINEGIPACGAGGSNYWLGIE